MRKGEKSKIKIKKKKYGFGKKDAITHLRFP